MQPPDDSKAHHREVGSLRSLELGLEFDYRLFWLRTADGQRLAALGNLVDTAFGKPRLWPPGAAIPRSITTLTVAVFDPQTAATWQATCRGDVNDAFHFASARDSGFVASWSGEEARLCARGPGFEVDLQASATKPAAMFTDERGVPGVVDNGKLGLFKYVQYTTMKAVGRVQINGRDHAVQGHAWRDRQWMTRGIMATPQPCAWRWFALQLSEPSVELMLYEMWDPLTGRVFRRYAGLVDSASGFHLVADTQFRIQVLECEREGQRSIERAWSIELPTVGSGVVLRLDRIPGSPWIRSRSGMFRHEYLEGPCRVSGARGIVRAWAEQVDLRWIHVDLAPPDIHTKTRNS